MLNKRCGICTSWIGETEFIEVVSNKWKNKCFFCRAYFKRRGENNWRQHCKIDTYDACMGMMPYKKFIPRKFIRLLKYAVKTKEGR